MTRIPVPCSGTEPPHVSDRTALVCRCCLPPWPTRAASVLRKTRNQFYPRDGAGVRDRSREQATPARPSRGTQPDDGASRAASDHSAVGARMCAPFSERWIRPLPHCHRDALRALGADALGPRPSGQRPSHAGCLCPSCAMRRSSKRRGAGAWYASVTVLGLVCVEIMRFLHRGKECIHTLYVLAYLRRTAQLDFTLQIAGRMKVHPIAVDEGITCDGF